jgi:hypothetical protein
MKKLIAIVLVLFFLVGCGAGARESGFWQNETVYQNWDHLWFSWYGHETPTARDARLAQEQNWWGIEVPYIPAR